MSTATQIENVASNKAGELALVGAELTDSDSGQQFLTFMLAGEEYGVDILKVQEIKGWKPVTRVPNTPEYVKGVLNLRGTIVPVVDMRMRFSLEQVEYSAATVIIVLSVRSGDVDRIIGVVVDAVSDVMNVEESDIKPAPDFGAKVKIDFVSGLATVGDHMVMLLDVDKLLTETELSELETVSE